MFTTVSVQLSPSSLLRLIEWQRREGGVQVRPVRAPSRRQAVQDGERAAQRACETGAGSDEAAASGSRATNASPGAGHKR